MIFACCLPLRAERNKWPHKPTKINMRQLQTKANNNHRTSSKSQKYEKTRVKVILRTFAKGNIKIRQTVLRSIFLFVVRWGLVHRCCSMLLLRCCLHRSNLPSASSLHHQFLCGCVVVPSCVCAKLPRASCYRCYSGRHGRCRLTAEQCRVSAFAKKGWSTQWFSTHPRGRLLHVV